MEETQLERQFGVAPPGIVRPVADIVILLVREGGQLLWLGVAGLLVGRGRQLFGAVRHVVEPEGERSLPRRQPGEQQKRGPWRNRAGKNVSRSVKWFHVDGETAPGAVLVAALKRRSKSISVTLLASGNSCLQFPALSS